MKLLVTLLLLSSFGAAAADTLTIFGHPWTVPFAADWKIDQDSGVSLLRLVASRGPVPGPRRPIQFAVAETPALENITLEADVRPMQRSLIIVYAFRDAAHFNYAHLSTDTGAKQPVHNGIFHVFGGERVRISSQAGPAAFPATGRWYHVQLVQESKSGKVQVSVDGKPVPALTAYDLSLTSGKVALGSFDETADFKNVKIGGSPSR